MISNRIILVVVVLAGMLFSVPAVSAETALEPWSYTQDFETGELSAWASYPVWQDAAYDPNFHIGTIVPGDPNISVVQVVTPYTSVDNYAGAQKKLDMYLVPGSSIRLRYYVKTNLPVAFFKVRLAAGPDGKLDYTIPSPATNRWEWVTVTYDDFAGENLNIKGRGRIKVNALAVLAKIPDADPAMPFYLGIDDVTVTGQRAVHFRFAVPPMHKLSEWKPYIADRHYTPGDTFTLQGTWPLKARRIELTVTDFTHPDTVMLTTNLKKKGDTWSGQFKLTYPAGIYLGTMKALDGGEVVSETSFTFVVAPEGLGGTHPRLWFDKAGQEVVEDRLTSGRFSSVAKDISSRAKRFREDNPIESIVDEVDQFHTVMINNVPIALYPWFDRINVWRGGVHQNSLAGALLGDAEAAEYAKALMLRLSTFPQWVHQWFIERGRHIYYPVGEFGQEMALAYDLLYDTMDESERRQVRDALRKQVVLGCHKGYVEDDIVTNNTSNWVAHITGGSLMCQLAMYGDGPDEAALVHEPYFSGVIFKLYDLIKKVYGIDGSYGEGYGYYNFTMLSLSKVLPAAETVFNIDMSGKIRGSYRELIWAGLVREKQMFYFGDSGGSLGPITNWAWLLAKHHDPLLGWFYNHQKGGETFMDVLYETEDVPQDDPFDEEPVTFFRDVGTTVFKSGWETDDFVFVMRTGAFYNHQHIDQGSFWLSDRGSVFIEERHGSTYYLDPLYQPWYTQPVAHSTILIDHNHQSQRTGDPRRFAEGFNDYAHLCQYLDGGKAAFSSGDIDGVYWGEVSDMKRNVLYLKSRTVLMIDTIVPAKRDVDVTLLYQTRHLEDIDAGSRVSTITKDGNTLHIMHLSPEKSTPATVETPHYLYTLRNEKPLKEEGMLTVTARTNIIPLVMTNLLTVTAEGERPDVTCEERDGYLYGKAAGTPFAVTTRPGTVYDLGEMRTDALAIAFDGTTTFAAMCTTLSGDSIIDITSGQPITCELAGNTVRYFRPKCGDGKVVFGLDRRPGTITVKGESLSRFSWDAAKGTVTLTLPAGEGTVEFTF